MNKITISKKIQKKLLIIVFVALIASTSLIFIFNTQINNDNYSEIIASTIEDVKKDLEDTSDINMIEQTFRIKERVVKKIDINNMPEVNDMNDYLRTIVEEEKFSEMSIVNKENIIIYSSIDEYIDFDMNANEDTLAFDALNHGATEIVQPVRHNAYSGLGDYDIYNKYAGVFLEDIGYLQVGVSAKRFQELIDEKVEYIAANRHIGQSGYVIISNSNDVIVSNANGANNISLSELGLVLDKNDENEKPFKAYIDNQEHLCISKFVEGYYIIGVVPTSEIQSFRNRAAISNLIAETLVLAIMLILINTSIRNDIVNKIHNINTNLHKIIEGKTDVTIDEYSTKEFSELSTDINSTIQALKDYSEKEKEKLKEELNYAKSIQISALPRNFPNDENYEIFALMEAAKGVGGDFYDFYKTFRHGLNFMIADVSGKGIPGAMFMMRSKSELHSLTETGIPVNDVFTYGNDRLCENNDAGMFVTAWEGNLDLKSGHVHFTNAGHNPPVIMRKDGKCEFIRGKAGFVLAGMEGIQYQLQELHMNPGDILFLYTDGVVEATNSQNELYGEQRLLNCLNTFDRNMSMEYLCCEVIGDVGKFVGDNEQFDDITMLALRYKGHNEK